MPINHIRKNENMKNIYMENVFKAILLMLLVAGLFGCGGGGGGSSSGAPGSGSSKSVSISWEVPSTKMDGSTLTPDEIAGFKIYYGTESGTYTEVVDTGFAQNYTIDNLSAGATYYFAITCYDIHGNESGFSVEVSKTI